MLKRKRYSLFRGALRSGSLSGPAEEGHLLPSEYFPGCCPLLLFVLFFPLLFSSCATSSAGIALSDIPLEGKEYRVAGPASASDWWTTIDFGLIAFPLSRPPIDEVLRQARLAGGGNALRNIRYTQDEIVILFVHIHRLYLRGDAVVVVDPDQQKAGETARGNRRDRR